MTRRVPNCSVLLIGDMTHDLREPGFLNVAVAVARCPVAALRSSHDDGVSEASPDRGGRRGDSTGARR